MKLLSYQPHRKIYYPAGLISLVMLPALCIWWLHQHKAFERKGAIEVIFYSPDVQKQLPTEYQFEFPPKREYVTIPLRGNDKDDKASLGYARSTIKRLRAQKDTLSGVYFHFGKKAKYWTFVHALDVCKTEGIPFQACQNYIIALYPNGYFVPRTSLVCGMVYDNLHQNKTSRYSVSKDIPVMKGVIEDYWAPGLLFIVMCSSVFVRIYNARLSVAN